MMNRVSLYQPRDRGIIQSPSKEPVTLLVVTLVLRVCVSIRRMNDACFREELPTSHTTLRANWLSSTHMIFRW